MRLWETHRKTILFVTHGVDGTICQAGLRNGHVRSPWPLSESHGGRPEFKRAFWCV